MKTSIRFRLVERPVPVRETTLVPALPHEDCSDAQVASNSLTDSKFDNFILVLLAEQEWRQGRVSRAECLIDAAYNAFDTKPARKRPHLCIVR